MAVLKRFLLIMGVAGSVALAGCGDDGGGGGDSDAMPPGDAVLAMSPSTSDFGSVVIGATSSPTTFTVTNNGESASGSISTSITGATLHSIASDGCAGTTLAAGASCTITAVFSPDAAGASSGSLTATATPGGTVSATLDGEGATPGELTISPTPHDFGDVVVGSTSATQDFTVENTGDSETSSLTASLSGAGATQFDVASDDCTGSTLAAGATCTVTVAFDPSSAGAKSATLSVDGSQLDAVNATLNGNALADADLDISPISPDFGSVTEGTQSGNVTFTVTNNGGIASGAIVTEKAGTDANDFTIQNDNCDGNSLTDGASCTIVVRFTPAAGSIGGKTASLQVTGTPGGIASAVLTGDSVAAGALTISPTPHDFGEATVGTTGSSNTFTVTNTGGSATGNISVTLGGNNPTDFPIVAGGNGCQNVTLQPDTSCSISVNFNPSNGGARSASLAVSASPGGGAAASLTGQGLAPAALSLTPPQSDFGSVATDKVQDVNFTLTNTGDSTSGVPVLNVGGTDFGRFVIQGTPCTSALAGGASCTITVRFSPNSVADFSAVLEATASPGGTDSSNLVGEGITPAALVVNESTHAYDNTVEDQDSLFQTFTFTNNGTETTGLLSVALVGDDPGEFDIGTNGCANQALAAGADCTVQVLFAPTTPGDKVATLQVAGTPGGSVNVALSGEALEKLLLTPNPTDFGAVRAGDSTTEFITVRNPAESLLDRDDLALTIIGTNATDFAIAGGGSCVDGQTLAPDASCTVAIEFASSGTPGDRDADLQATASGGTDVSSHLDAEVQGPIEITPVPAEFADTVIGDSTSETFTVTNHSADSSTGMLSTSLSLGGDFAITTDNCVGESLAAGGGACTIVVKFFPQSSGTHTGSFTVSAPLGTDTVDFEGEGLDAALLSLNDDDVDFGDVRIGSSAVRDFTLTNNGEETATGIALSLSDTDNYEITANTCDAAPTPNELAPTASCTFSVTFAPPQGSSPSDAVTGTVTVAYNGALVTGAQNIVADLSGASLSQITIVNAVHDFGEMVIGGSTSAVAFTVTNESDAAINGLSVESLSDSFAVTGTDCANLTAGAACQVSVQFEPASIGGLTGDLRVFSGNSASAVAALSGTGLSLPDVSATPNELFFGGVVQGSNSATRTIVFENLGGSPTETLTTVESNADDFDILTNDCNAVLQPQGSCSMTVRFSPDTSGAGTQSGTIAVSNAVVTVSGEALAQQNTLTLNPTFVTFDDTVEGESSNVVQFTVTNNGTGSANAPALSIGGTDSAQFAIDADTCIAVLPSGGTCTVDVVFAPSVVTVGELTATLLADSDTYDVTGTAVAELRGDSEAAANLSLTPTGTQTFGDVALNSSGSITFTLENSGEQAATGISLALAGASANHYAIANSDCGASLAGESSCQLDVVFTPTTAGTKSAELNLNSTLGGTATIGLTGRGVGDAIIGITPSTSQVCDPATRPGGWLPAVLTGNNECKDFTVSNTGGVATGNLVVDLSGSDFIWQGSDLPDGHVFDDILAFCEPGQPIAAGSSCMVRVWYTPQTANENDSTTLTVSASPGDSDGVNISAASTPALFLFSGEPSFGSVNVGLFVEEVFTFENDVDTVGTNVLTVNLDDPNNQFGIQADTCSGETIAPSGTCSVTVRFVPTSTGSKSATLTVTDSSVNKTEVVNLTGTATNN